MEYINTNIKRAAGYLKSYIPLIIVNLTLGVLSAAAVAAPVYVIQNLIDDTLNGKDYERLLLICGGLFLLYLVKGVVFYYQSYTSEKISSGIVYEIRQELYENLQRLSLRYFSKLKIGDIISRFSNDSQKFRDSLISLSGSVVKIFTILFLLGKIFLINWKLSLITLIFIPLLAKVARSFAKKLYKTGGEIQRKIGKLTTYLQETILGIAVIKAFAKEDIAIENFKKLNKKNYEARIKNIKVSARVTPLIDLSNVISIIIILLFGGYEVIKTGSMTTGDFMAFLLGVGLLSDPLRVLTKTYNKLTTNLTALERIFEILDKKPEIQEKEDAIRLENVDGKIDIK
ncbi:MAG: ABC transporter transmembrane domain-containing protein, partial [Fusobacteriota bacterium]